MTREPRVDPPTREHHAECPAHPDHEAFGIYPCACAQLDDDYAELAAEAAIDAAREEGWA